MLRRRIADRIAPSVARQSIAVWMTFMLLLAMVASAPCFASGLAPVAATADLHRCCEHTANVKSSDCCGSFTPVPPTASDATPNAAFFLVPATSSSIGLKPQAAVGNEIPTAGLTARRTPATVLRT